MNYRFTVSRRRDTVAELGPFAPRRMSAVPENHRFELERIQRKRIERTLEKEKEQKKIRKMKPRSSKHPRAITVANAIEENFLYPHFPTDFDDSVFSFIFVFAASKLARCKRYTK